MKFETNTAGDKMWCNEKGQFHNIIEPAYVYLSGSKLWCRNGKFHRLDGPAKERPKERSNEKDYWCWLGKHITEQQHSCISNLRFFTKRVKI